MIYEFASVCKFHNFKTLIVTMYIDLLSALICIFCLQKMGDEDEKRLKSKIATC